MLSGERWVELLAASTASSGSQMPGVDQSGFGQPAQGAVNSGRIDGRVLCADNPVNLIRGRVAAYFVEGLQDQAPLGCHAAAALMQYPRRLCNQPAHSLLLIANDLQ